MRKESEDITPDYPGLAELIPNMFETLTASDGVGLAAPQIGKNIRLAVIDLDVVSDELPEYKDFRRAFINPHIVEIDEESPVESMEEGCLSLEGVRKTKRYRSIKVQYQNENLQTRLKTFTGWTAQIIQHEIDHCNGILI